MDWTELDAGFELATVACDMPHDEAILDIFSKLADKVLPLRTGEEWDHIRMEFWADSGRVVVYPALSNKQDRTEKAGCQVVFEDLLRTYESLANSELTDDAFEVQINKELHTWTDEIISIASKSPLTDTRLIFIDSASGSLVRDITIT